INPFSSVTVNGWLLIAIKFIIFCDLGSLICQIFFWEKLSSKLTYLTAWIYCSFVVSPVLENTRLSLLLLKYLDFQIFLSMMIFHMFMKWRCTKRKILCLSLIHISEPTRLLSISYAVFCLKKKK